LRIVQICNNPLFNSKGVLNGGIEKVIVDTHELLQSHGFDSNIIHFDTSEESTIKKNKRLLSKLLEYDVVIIHNHQSIVKYLNKENKPFIFVEHWSLESINKLYYYDFFTRDYQNAKKNGSIFLTVSQTAKDFKENFFKKKWGINFTFDGFIKFQHLSRELDSINVSEGNGKAITIARASREKQIHLIDKLPNIDYDIISIPFKDNKSYYDRNLKQIEEKILWNLDRKTTLDKLRKASVYYATCRIESAGIAPFEALCSGLPLVLNEGEFGHASRMFAPKDAWYICRSDENEKIEEFKKLSLEQRQQISKEVREYNSVDNFIESFKYWINKLCLK